MWMDHMQGQYSLLMRDASISAASLDLLSALSVAISASILDLLKTLSVRSAMISASTLDLLKAASVTYLSASISAATLDLLSAPSTATSASILDLLSALSVAISASILDLRSADSVAALEAARSAANLDLRRAPSTSSAVETLRNEANTCSRGSRDSRDRTSLQIKFDKNQSNSPNKFYSQLLCRSTLNYGKQNGEGTWEVGVGHEGTMIVGVIQQMEQNQQSQQLQQEETVELEPSKNSTEDEWQKVRNEFASHEESIGQSQDVAALVQKWIWIQFQQQFKVYEQQLMEKGDPQLSLRSVIDAAILQEKQASWIINQKYGMEQVNQLILKIRTNINEILTHKVDPNPEMPQQQVIPVKPPSPNISIFERDLMANYSSLLPEIKPKGRLYHPKEMASSFHLQKQTEQDYQLRSPFMFQQDKKGKMPRSSLFHNKYLKNAFKWFCKQGYNSSGMFQDFSKEADKMTLNKWMVFCKEFDFLEKFHKKELVSIYQNATKFASLMPVQDFLTAVALLQEKYVMKQNHGEADFVGEVLKINNEAAFKVKMDNLKVRYSGPRKNFFENATYTEKERKKEIQKEKQFQMKKKEREIVLIKGMFAQHLQDQIGQLKAKRQENNANRHGYSLNMLQTKQKPPEIPLKSSRMHNLNYSKIFQLNREQITKRTTNTTTATNAVTSNNSMYKTEQMKPVEHKKIDGRTMKNTHNNSSISNPQANKTHQVRQEHTWLTRLRSDSEQSDEILKEHMLIQQKLKTSKERNKVHDLMLQMRERSKQVEQMRLQIQRENQADQIAETQTDFKKGRGVVA